MFSDFLIRISGGEYLSISGLQNDDSHIDFARKLVLEEIKNSFCPKDIHETAKQISEEMRNKNGIANAKVQLERFADSRYVSLYIDEINKVIEFEPEQILSGGQRLKRFFSDISSLLLACNGTTNYIGIINRIFMDGLTTPSNLELAIMDIIELVREDGWLLKQPRQKWVDEADKRIQSNR